MEEYPRNDSIKEYGRSDCEQLSTLYDYTTFLHTDKEYKNCLHNGMVLFRVNEGSIVICSARPEIIVEKGELGFVGAHQLYNVLFKKGALHIQIIEIHMGFILSTIRATTLFHQVMKVTQDIYTHQYFDDIVQYQQNEELAGTLTYRGSLLLLLGKIASNIYAVDDLKNHDKKRKTYHMTCYIEEHCDEKITLDLLSKEFGYTPQYISSIFKEELNTTFHHYLTYKRLKKSLFLLNSTKLKIIDIAYACGFSNERSFIKSFKERYGISPSQYKFQRKQ